MIGKRRYAVKRTTKAMKKILVYIKTKRRIKLREVCDKFDLSYDIVSDILSFFREVGVVEKIRGNTGEYELL